MSIRQKLFVAFLTVAAISIAALLMLARDYTRSVREELDRRFLDDARAAFDRQGEEAQRRMRPADLAVSTLAGTADVLAPLSSSGVEGGVLDTTPVILQLGIWDARRRELVRSAARSTADANGSLVEVLDAVHLLEQPRGGFRHLTYPFGVSPGEYQTWHVSQSGRRYVVALVGAAEAPSSAVVAELDGARLFTATAIGRDGHAWLWRSGAPWLAPDETERLRRELPGLDRLVARAPPRGQMADIDDGRGRSFRLYAATASELPLAALPHQVRALAAIPLDELYAPLRRIYLRVLISIGVTALLALAAALLLSGWFVGDIERIRRAVAAFAKGDWTRLEKSSRDELGGALIDSFNHMAAAVAERMRKEEADSWRRLVRVLSHEINNTLAPIGSVAATLRSGLPKRLPAEDSGEDVELALRLIVERVDALATFIDGYAEVAKLPAPERRPVELGPLLADTTALFAEQAAVRGITLELQCPSGLVAALDSLQLERVLTNLVKNAIEAARDGGAVVVRAVRHLAQLEVTVADDGAGIGAEARRNLFVPYFTTKPGGSGIGLTLARQIVVAHGGTLSAESRDGGGTLMRIVLPDVRETDGGQ
jgi:signal transduction histidine kinase